VSGPGRIVELSVDFDAAIERVAADATITLTRLGALLLKRQINRNRLLRR
jgi:hypothetical protein